MVAVRRRGFEVLARDMTQSKHVGGVVVPLVTPFDHHGDLAAENARGLIEQLLDLGVHGFYVGGSTGEGFFSQQMIAVNICSSG